MASHIPYHDSKLTCLLQDSLGGNTHTLNDCLHKPCSMEHWPLILVTSQHCIFCVPQRCSWCPPFLITPFKFASGIQQVADNLLPVLHHSWVLSRSSSHLPYPGSGRERTIVRMLLERVWGSVVQWKRASWGILTYQGSYLSNLALLPLPLSATWFLLCLAILPLSINNSSSKNCPNVWPFCNVWVITKW